MLETNLRIVDYGQELYVPVRRANVTGPDLTPDLLQDACGVLRHRHGLAAVPATSRTLWVASSHSVPTIHLAGDNWCSTRR